MTEEIKEKDKELIQEETESQETTEKIETPEKKETESDISEIEKDKKDIIGDIDFNPTTTKKGDYNPLDDDVKERDYANIKADVSNEPIPEPEIGTPKIEIPSDDEETSGGSESEGEEKSDKERKEERKEHREEHKNPALKNASEKERRRGAEYLADFTLRAYAMLNDAAKSMTQFGEDKMQKRALKKKFDYSILEYELKLSEEVTMTIEEFLSDINNQAEEVFQVDDKFNEEARELLVEIFMQKGWGLTPEQRLLFLFLEDAAPKVQAMFTMIKSRNNIINMAMIEIKESRKERERLKEKQKKKEDLKAQEEALNKKKEELEQKEREMQEKREQERKKEAEQTEIIAQEAKIDESTVDKDVEKYGDKSTKGNKKYDKRIKNKTKQDKKQTEVQKNDEKPKKDKEHEGAKKLEAKKVKKTERRGRPSTKKSTTKDTGKKRGRPTKKK